MTNIDVLQQLKHLIGSRYVPSVKAYISELTGHTRVVGIGEISTTEVDSSRIRIRGDEAGVIQGFDFH
jgi:hypothetical protein